MARLRRRWRVVKWVGLLLSLTVAGVWLASFHWTLRYVRSRILHASTIDSFRVEQTTKLPDEFRKFLPIRVTSGYTLLLRSHPGGLTGVYDGRDEHVSDKDHWSWSRVDTLEPRQRTVLWSPVFACDRLSGAFTIPFWIPFLLLATPTALLLWRDRRLPPYCCQACGYDLTGNVTGVCPECGKSSIARRGGQSGSANPPVCGLDYADKHR